MSDGRLDADAEKDESTLPEGDRALAIIWPLLGRHIAFHRRLVDLTANVKAALLLSQAIYWTRHGRDIARRGGWFLKTMEQWEMETGLSPKEQATARALLRELAMLEEQRVGVPARLHFRLSAERLGELLSERMGRRSPGIDWSDAVLLAELLGPTLAFHRSLARIAGGVHPGLMLSRAIYLTRLQWTRRIDSWIPSSEAQWATEIGLTRREQEAARRDLVECGIWEEERVGIPPRLKARVRLDGLLSRLADGVRASPTVFAVPVAPERAIPTFQLPPIGESSPRQSRNLELPKPPDQIRRNRHHSDAESAELHIRSSTRDSVQPQSPRDPALRQQSGGELIFPDQFLPGERASAAALLRRRPGEAQALLDELTGRLDAKSVRTSPIAYLRGLLERSRAGTFVPELGPRIAAARRQRDEERALRMRQIADEQRRAAERLTPEYQARVDASLEAMRQLLGVSAPARRTGGLP